MDPSLPEAPYPYIRPVPRPLPAPRAPTKGEKAADNVIEMLSGNSVGGAGDKEARSKLIKMAIEALLNRAHGGDVAAGAHAHIGEEGMVAVGIDEHGLWVEPVKDVADAAAVAAGKKDTAAGGSKAKTKDTISASLDQDKKKKKKKKATKEEEEEEDGILEIQIDDGQDANSLADILRLAGYDVRYEDEDGEWDEADDDSDPRLKSHDEL